MLKVQEKAAVYRARLPGLSPATCTKSMVHSLCGRSMEALGLGWGVGAGAGVRRAGEAGK